MQKWKRKNVIFLQFLQNWYIFGKFMFVYFNFCKIGIYLANLCLFI